MSFWTFSVLESEEDSSPLNPPSLKLDYRMMKQQRVRQNQPVTRSMIPVSR